MITFNMQYIEKQTQYAVLACIAVPMSANKTIDIVINPFSHTFKISYFGIKPIGADIRSRCQCELCS